MRRVEMVARLRDSLGAWRILGDFDILGLVIPRW